MHFMQSGTPYLTGLLKTAIVRLLRKGIKDPTIAGNYRPISLLSIHCLTLNERVHGAVWHIFAPKTNIQGRTGPTKV
jgi:hypothetical protein